MRLKLLAAAAARARALRPASAAAAPDQLLTLTAGRGAAGRDAAQRRRRARRSPSSCRPCRRRCARPASRSMSATPAIQYLEGRGLGGESRRAVRAACSARRSRRAPAGSCSIPSQYSHDPGTRLTGTLVKFGLDPDRDGGGGRLRRRASPAAPTAASSPTASRRACPVADADARQRSRPGAQPGRQPASPAAGRAWVRPRASSARRSPGSARLFEACSNTSLLSPGVATIRSSSARISAARVLAEAAPAAERRDQLGRGLRVELVRGEDHVGEEAIAAARRRRGRRAG